MGEAAARRWDDLAREWRLHNPPALPLRTNAPRASCALTNYIGLPTVGSEQLSEELFVVLAGSVEAAAVAGQRASREWGLHVYQAAELGGDLARWCEACRVYEGRAGERLNDSIKCATVTAM